MMNTTVDTVYDTCSSIQTAWINGNISRYDMVDLFLDELVPEESLNEQRLLSFLPNVNVIVTTVGGEAVVIEQADSREKLVDLMTKTTFIPLFTGRGMYFKSLSPRDGQFEEQLCLDGGFSRVLHPSCDHTVRVPLTWSTMLNTLNPRLSRASVFDLWEMGRSSQHPFYSSNSFDL